MSERFIFHHMTDLPGVQWIEPVVHGDERGFFMETYRARDFADHIVHRLGLNVPVIAIRTEDYPTPARRPAWSVLADRKFALEGLNGMRSWEDALDDCLLRYREELFHA